MVNGRAALLVLLSWLAVAALGFSCVCTPSECEPTSDADCPQGAGTVWDPCGCCRVCARTENQPCGGPYGFYGSCGEGLQCVVSDVTSDGTEGTCKRVPGSVAECSEPMIISGCNVVAGSCHCGEAPICPGDISMAPYTFADLKECSLNLNVMHEHAREIATQVGLNCSNDSDGGCQEIICPGDSVPTSDGGCSCSLDKCHEPPPCPRSVQPKLKKTGTLVPGDCCDVYECPSFDEDIDCSSVLCPHEEAKECPPDSYRLPEVKSGDGKCCSTSLGCDCLPGPCQTPNCPSPSRLILVRTGDNKPGSCCSIYQCLPPPERNRTCFTHGGEEVSDGEKWAKDNCSECRCDGGVIKCASIEPCHPLPEDCSSSSIPPGQCCPVCNTVIDNISVTPGGCATDTGIIYGNGASWQEEDCIHCTCYNGTMKCQAAMCIQTCANATLVKGECCPKCNVSSVVTVPEHCPPISDCTLKCKHGLAKDDLGCFQCSCQEGPCDLKCEWGYRLDDNGVKLCECIDYSETEPPLISTELSIVKCKPLIGCQKKCKKHRYQTDINGCEICKCEHPCKSISHRCNKKCPYGFLTNSKGCPICKCHPFQKENDMELSSPRPCISDESMKDDGESWFDGCRHCYCNDGKEMCSLITCPKLDCPLNHVKSGACCPSCLGDDIDDSTILTSPPHGDRESLCFGEGWLKREGEEWMVGNCIKCRCTDGRSACMGEPCQPAPCQYPVVPEGECCPVCPPVSTALVSLEGCGGGRKAGEQWREGVCVSCICLNGIASCHTESCAEAPCETPVMVKNQCCPVCLGDWQQSLTSNSGCLVGNTTREIGSEWDQDNCIRCACLPGRTISCKRLDCVEDMPTSSKWWNDEGVYLAILLCSLVFVGVTIGFVARHCYSGKRYKLKLAPPPSHTLNLKYKNVPTYEGRAPV